MTDISMLGYEQLLALKIMRDHPNKEASVIAKDADCSWDELLAMAQRGLIDLGINRLETNKVHPIITLDGVRQAKLEEVIYD